MSHPEPEAPGEDAELTAARRRAGVVAAVAGLGLVPYFLLVSNSVGLPVDDAPPVGAPTERFVTFYVDHFSELRLSVTLAIGMWVIWLVLLLAVVRAASRRIDLAAILAMVLAGAATAVFVVAEGVLVWPVVLSDMTRQNVRDNLDPGVAQAMVLSRDGIHATAIVLLGVSMLVIAWLLARSDLWGHWAMSVVAALAALPAIAQIMVGSDGLGPGLILPWGILVGILVLVGRRRAPASRSSDATEAPLTPA